MNNASTTTVRSKVCFYSRSISKIRWQKTTRSTINTIPTIWYWTTAFFSFNRWSLCEIKLHALLLLIKHQSNVQCSLNLIHKIHFILISYGFHMIFAYSHKNIFWYFICIPRKTLLHIVVVVNHKHDIYYVYLQHMLLNMVSIRSMLPNHRVLNLFYSEKAGKKIISNRIHISF